MGRPRGKNPEGRAGHGAPPPDAGDPGISDDLPYRIELWSTADRGPIEKILGRAANVRLAHAIFNAAQTEYPGRRISLRRGARIIAEWPE